MVATDTVATYPQNPDTLLAGINLAITSVKNTTAGKAPTVNFTVEDDKGNNIPVVQARIPAIHHGWPDSRLWLHQLRTRHHQHPGLCYRKRLEGDLRLQLAIAPTRSRMPFRPPPREPTRSAGRPA